MITKFLTNVSVAFNPFSRGGKTARLFMALLPPDARQTMKIDTRVLDRFSEHGGSVDVTFKDGKKIKLDTNKMSIDDVVEEMDRHSRQLRRAEELAG